MKKVYLAFGIISLIFASIPIIGWGIYILLSGEEINVQLFVRGFYEVNKWKPIVGSLFIVAGTLSMIGAILAV